MSDLQRITINDFSKGVNLAANPYDVAKEQSDILVNLILDEHGSLRTREGTLIQDGTAPANVRILKLYDFIAAGKATIKMAIGYLTTDTKLRLYLRSANPWTQIGALTLGSTPGYQMPDIVNFAGTACIIAGVAAGASAPRFYTYDGTTLAQFALVNTMVPGALHVAVHLSSLWLWGTDVNYARNTFDGPSAAAVTAPNAVGSLPTANRFFVDKDDGDNAMGCGEFTVAETGISPTSVLVLFKNFAAYQATSLPQATVITFSVQKIKTDMGCVAPRTIKFAPGAGIIRLSHRGFALYDGVNDTLISEEIRPYLFGDIGVGLNWAQITTAHAVVVPNPPMYLAFCPTSTNFPDTVFMYDLVRRSWTILTFPTALSCSQLETFVSGTAFTITAQPQVLTGDTTGLQVRRIFQGDTTDDGSAINWSAILRAVGGPQQNSYWRRAILKIVNVTNGQTVAWGVMLGPNTQGTSPRSKTGTLTTPNAAAFRQTFNGTTLVPNPELDMTMDLGLIGTNLRLILSGAGPITIRGVEYHHKPKPVARPTVFA